ncbi:MAG: hypothetical protein HZA78_08065 [Candidatus Schekmanbacteria bacterium]|nr:hypothetical protein [Candidatus Schekmanbacteria bacterium]
MHREQKLKTLAVEYKVDFGNGKKHIRAKKKPAANSTKPTNKPAYITRLLALAHHLQDLIDQGVVQDYADIARLSGLTKARVSQIMHLTLLAPQIQEEILIGNPQIILKGHALRIVLKTAIWEEQAELLEKLEPDLAQAR